VPRPLPPPEQFPGWFSALFPEQIPQRHVHARESVISLQQIEAVATHTAGSAPGYQQSVLTAIPDITDLRPRSQNVMVNPPSTVITWPVI
jgi:hypothetical protein